MTTRFLLFLMIVSVALACSSCRTHSGSREFIPGKGWVPND